MLKLNVPDMTCGHCAGTVTKAIQSIDAGAKVDVDLETQTVTIEANSDGAAFAHALEVAGYPATVSGAS
ncbi:MULTISPECIES: heavy-metal-associated domain-containing protein [unclassified Beijerinckia]|uniref:heavy-metal-associated domain-containing protein n=1 Tax=unclassified Beijerinckia TaxID=2638183 RepID=UPI000899CF23|nr:MULTISPECIES: heavy-metal-associated domain-containing protein [unclassified Beijerinckia]MDH7799113.1 copper chaperone [Beijerinckia sp. GAS462]SED94653.1 copper chaperone [Beijerinckia sp. 28-YEA-48]